MFPTNGKKPLHRIISFFIAAVWVANGIVKVFNLVPRHRQIVTRILGVEHSVILTKSIGLAEIAMAIWILSGIKRRLNTIIQIIIIAIMNILEFIIAPDLLLWGRMNLVYATLFMLLIYYNTFILDKYPVQQT